MNRQIAPVGLAAPAANYAHAVVSLSATRWLHTSGAVATRSDGSVPDDLAEQADVIWGNLLAMLEEAEMEVADIVSVTTYVVVGNDLSVVMAARDRVMGEHRAASTLVPVPALARPQWKMEIAIIAAA
jgi:2-iminobutanoate/2-iminopropanoate deaminase